MTLDEGIEQWLNADDYDVYIQITVLIYLEDISGTTHLTTGTTHLGPHIWDHTSRTTYLGPHIWDHISGPEDLSEGRALLSERRRALLNAMHARAFAVPRKQQARKRAGRCAARVRDSVVHR